jgi:hypothetical protein
MNYFIEVLVRWTELKMKERNDGEAYLKRIVDGEDNPYDNLQAYHDYSPMVIDIYDIARFNKSHDTRFTTLRMKDGDGYVIKYPYKDFMELYISSTGRSILSCTPEDEEGHNESSTNEGAGGYDETDSGIDGDDDFGI